MATKTEDGIKSIETSSKISLEQWFENSSNHT